ncbi:RNA polymerase, sigma-24 subunit, ECF subfamily protein [Flammeovirgaceae bacterium 311]|nr:RNA polymerase, sigma-24 subunit, ECF subfamily protein [Flammeovirgaceae bacterium 311]
MEDIYTKYRPYLFSVAYNILGEIQEAEDLVQDAFVEVLKMERGEVKNIKPYLTRVVANKSIDRLHALKKQRELYPGTWLPEPLITPTEGSHQEGILQYEVLHALDQLNPTERAAFVLRTAFDYPYQELAQICNTSEANCRQLVSRSRQKVADEVKTSPPHTADQQPLQQLMEAFLQSCAEGNPEQLTRLLKKDIALYSDGGGKAAAALNVLYGHEVVSKFLIGVTRKKLEQQLTLQQLKVNNLPAVLFSVNGVPDSLLYINRDGSLLSQIFIMRNPDKIILQ